jgi:hypothetical protein
VVSDVRTVTAEVSFLLLVPGQQGGVPLVATLSYTTADPYAVRLAFHVGLGEPVEWIFARDLLDAGAERPAGDGDVMVCPVGGAADDRVRIELSSPFGEARFEALTEDVCGFLCRAYDLVPEGAEPGYVDVDAELECLGLRAGGTL